MTTNIKPLVTVNTAQIASNGEHIYHELKEELEKKYFGRFVAIDTETKEYFLGETQIEASSKAKNKYPNKVFYLVKIGFPAVVTMSRLHSPILL